MTELPEDESIPAADDDELGAAPSDDSAAPPEAPGPLEAREDGGDADEEREPATPGEDAGDADEEREPATPEEVAEVAEEFVAGLLAAMGLDDVQVGSTIEGESAFVDVTGEGLGILIGRRGQTLDALQEVARTAVQRRLRSRIRLLVDVEGYRARRRKSLADYAKAMAARAKERGTEIELEPMTAYERKIVHDAVADIEGASSFSEGVEPYRKVVVRGE